MEKWVSGDYSQIEDFITKSPKWNYENEYRLFSAPKIIEAEKHHIQLKAIFYTTRFDEGFISVLKTLNKFHYENTLKIKEILPDNSYCKFVINERSPSCVDILSWVYENLEK